MLGGSVAEVQEHDPAPIQNSPNAVAPFSIPRNTAGGSLLRIEGGFVADRAIYNVVRGDDVGKPEILAIFGDAGFICSAAAKPLMDTVHPVALGLLVLGGLIYTAGVFVFISPQVRFRRAIWHGFVVTGASVHWAAILVGVVLAPATMG